MVADETAERAIDPVEALHASLERAWWCLSQAYDTTTSMPDLSSLFAGVDLSRPEQAAQAVVVSMLQEVMEAVGRFSPWYKQPARAFGLTSVREPLSLRSYWLLAPEAAQRWRDILEQLSGVIRRYSGLIQAMLLVEDLMGDISADDPCVTARCACWPPRTVQLRKSVLDKAEIICENCSQPFLERV
jgi:hypothetical protein